MTVDRVRLRRPPPNNVKHCHSSMFISETPHTQHFHLVIGGAVGEDFFMSHTSYLEVVNVTNSPGFFLHRKAL